MKKKKNNKKSSIVNKIDFLYFTAIFLVVVINIYSIFSDFSFDFFSISLLVLLYVDVVLEIFLVIKNHKKVKFPKIQWICMISLWLIVGMSSIVDLLPDDSMLDFTNTLTMLFAFTLEFSIFLIIINVIMIFNVFFSD